MKLGRDVSDDAMRQIAEGLLETARRFVGQPRAFEPTLRGLWRDLAADALAIGTARSGWCDWHEARRNWVQTDEQTLVEACRRLSRGEAP